MQKALKTIVVMLLLIYACCTPWNITHRSVAMTHPVYGNYCTGTILNLVHDGQRNYYVLTAKHCVEGPIENYTVRVLDTGKQYPAHLMTVGAEGIDLALLKVDLPKGTQYSTIARYGPVLNETIYMYGCHDGSCNIMVEGHVAKILHEQYGEQWVSLQMLDLAGLPGCSGSAVYNKHGMIVGVLVAARRGEFLLMVPAEHIKQFILDSREYL